MLITDQVATAPCTDPIQERFRTYEAKPVRVTLPASRLETEMLAEKLQHMILKTIRNLAGVSSLILFKTVRDSILIKYVVQCPLLAHPGHRHRERFLDTDEDLVCHGEKPLKRFSVDT